MSALFFRNFATLIALSALLPNCSHATSARPPNADTAPLGAPVRNLWQQIDASTRIPTGIHSSEAFDWADEPYNWDDDERPIYFHTAQESELTRPIWRPYFYRNESYPEDDQLRPNDKIAWRFRVRADVPYDRYFAKMNPNWQHRRGAFIGLGAPISDDYLHMFECDQSRPDGRHYRVRDFIVHCTGSRHLDVLIVADPSAQPPPTMAGDDLAYSAPRQLPERWIIWFLAARLGTHRANHPWNRNYAGYKTISVFAYSAAQNFGLNSKRFLEPRLQIRRRGRDYRWILRAQRVPFDDCALKDLHTRNCLPNRRDAD